MSASAVVTEGGQGETVDDIYWTLDTKEKQKHLGIIEGTSVREVVVGRGGGKITKQPTREDCFLKTKPLISLRKNVKRFPRQFNCQTMIFPFLCDVTFR